MKLKTVCISNFRNIDSTTYDLEKLNIFSGPNAKGKTNTILAIYWALTDFLIDGTSDYPSFKPYSDPSVEVSVELKFDSFSFKKTYRERWVKKRGADELNMEGHTTDYYVDDVKYSVTEGKRLLLENLKLDDIKVPSKVDIIRAVVDPYYLASNLEWKDLRVLIIELVGDVDDETVLNSNEVFVAIKGDLEKHKYNTEPLTKMYSQYIANNKKQLKENESYLAGYAKVEDVPKDSLNQALFNIELIDGEIETLKKQSDGSVNPNIQAVESQILEVRNDFVTSRENDANELVARNKKTNESINKSTEKLQKHRSELARFNDIRNNEILELKEYESKASDLENKLNDAVSKQSKLREKWTALNETEFVQDIKSQSCPHCGGILNESELDKHRTAWEENKQERLAEIGTEGSSYNDVIDNLRFQIKELVKPQMSNIENSILYEESGIRTATEELNKLREQLVLSYISDRTKELEKKGIDLKAQLEIERAIKSEDDIDSQIKVKLEKKKRYQELVDDHNAYNSIQRKVAEVKEVIKTIQNDLISNESKLMLLEEFIKTKLQMLKENVSSVFGDLEFVLIEQNIKEGSYNEVCYPLIIGTKTPFKDGSGAEKIVTGINIIESVKRRLGVGSLPIIFDEVDKLDNNTLSTLIVTDSQLISTRVDDVNFKEVELVKS